MSPRRAALLSAPLLAAVAAALFWPADRVTPPEPAPTPGAFGVTAAASDAERAQASAEAAAGITRPADPEYERCIGLAMVAPDRAVAEATRWRAEGGGDAARHCLAVALLQAGEPGRAATLLEELGTGALAPADARAALLGQAGQIWLSLDRPDRAYAAATLGLAARPDDVDLLTDRAIAAATQGRFEEAIEDLSRVLELRPARPEALVLRASAWRQTGHPALAADDLARALTIEPENPEALLERGLLRRDQGDVAAARRDLERVALLAPDQSIGALAREHLAALEGGPRRR